MQDRSRTQNGCQEEHYNKVPSSWRATNGQGGYFLKGYSRDITPICDKCGNLYLFMLIAIIFVFILIYSYLLMKSIYLIAVLPAKLYTYCYLLYLFYIY